MPRVILDWDKSYKRGVIISDFLDDIRSKFSVPNKVKAILTHKYGSSAYIPKRLHAISTTGRFDKGLFFDILRYLKTSPLEYEITITEKLQDHIVCGFDMTDFSLPKLKMDKVRPFQESGVHNGLKYGYGVFLIGTGGGKTFLMALLEKAFCAVKEDKTSTLIALPAQLIEQTYKDFLSFGIPEEDMSQWGNKHEFKKKPIIIASYKTLHAKLGTFRHTRPKKEKQFKTTDEFTIYLKDFKDRAKEREKLWKANKRRLLKELQQIDLLLLDEVHFLRGGNKLNKIVKLFDTNHKFGFTGTLPEEQLDKWNVIGKIGPVIENVTSFELRQMKFLSLAKAQVLKVVYKDPPDFRAEVEEQKLMGVATLPTDAYRKECAFIYENPFRNKVITHICSRFNNNALIMVNKLNHGEHLHKTLKAALPNKKVYWVRGEVEMSVREKIRELMEREDNIICVAMSKIFSTGINITNLHYIIFAQDGKAKVTLVQSIGRGLRLHKRKELLVIVDIADDLYYGREHLSKRLERYDAERIKYEVKNVNEP